MLDSRDREWWGEEGAPAGPRWQTHDCKPKVTAAAPRQAQGDALGLYTGYTSSNIPVRQHLDETSPTDIYDNSLAFFVEKSNLSN